MSELDMRVLDQDLRFVEEAVKGLHEPPGSPAYVRRLRDQAAVATLGGLLAALGRVDARELMEYRRLTERGANLAQTAKVLGRLQVEALGYQVPEDGEAKP